MRARLQSTPERQQISTFNTALYIVLCCNLVNCILYVTEVAEQWQKTYPVKRSHIWWVYLSNKVCSVAVMLKVLYCSSLFCFLKTYFLWHFSQNKNDRNSYIKSYIKVLTIIYISYKSHIHFRYNILIFSAFIVNLAFLFFLMLTLQVK